MIKKKRLYQIELQYVPMIYNVDSERERENKKQGEIKEKKLIEGKKKSI